MDWLLQFAYHISIDWTIIASAIGIVFGITQLTVSYELIKASTANPLMPFVMNDEIKR